MLDYEYILNYYSLTGVDLSRQQESDANQKAIQEIYFAGQLKNPDEAIVGDEYVSFTKLRKNQRNTAKLRWRKCNRFIKEESYEEARVKLTAIQPNKLKSSTRNKTGPTLRGTLKMKNCHINYF